MMYNLKLRALASATLLSMMVYILWTEMEKSLYGQVTARAVDDVICIILFVSLYFNSKQIIKHLLDR